MIEVQENNLIISRESLGNFSSLNSLIENLLEELSNNPRDNIQVENNGESKFIQGEIILNQKSYIVNFQVPDSNFLDADNVVW